MPRAVDRLRFMAAGVSAAEIEQGSKRKWQRSETNTEFKQALQSLGMDVPPIV